MTKIFISHPFAGAESINCLEAGFITESIIALGYLPINPLALFGNGGYVDAIHRDSIMEVCRTLIDISDEVWAFGKSPGCAIEIKYATDNRIPVRFFDSVYDVDCMNKEDLTCK